jgi:putative ABC transport system ATP-binding protein
MNDSIIVLQDVVKEYVMGEVRISAAAGISFEVNRGELVVVLGPSGAGKSTVLNIIGGMDRPTTGAIWVAGKNIAEFSDRELTQYRRTQIGFVFQFYNLMPNLTAMENVELAERLDNHLIGY